MYDGTLRNKSAHQNYYSPIFLDPVFSLIFFGTFWQQPALQTDEDCFAMGVVYTA
jgi:hypothetical protein